MKIPKLFPRKKLRATTARRSLGLPDEIDYEQMSEPNMKLSRALLIVLVLHVVAVAGIIAFNTIKPRQISSSPAVTPATETPSPAQTDAAKTETLAAASPAQTAKRDTAKPAHGPEKIIGKFGPKTDGAKPIEKASAPPGSPKTYVVAKGDKPVTIAKKFKVPYDQLMAANHIDDPHKLKIGQKLIIPTKPVPKPKKSEE
jgi:LysM repeat protein